MKSIMLTITVTALLSAAQFPFWGTVTDTGGIPIHAARITTAATGETTYSDSQGLFGNGPVGNSSSTNHIKQITAGVSGSEIHFSSAVNEDITLTIHTAAGRQLVHSEYRSTTGLNTISLTSYNLASGVYLFSVKSGTGLTRFKGQVGVNSLGIESLQPTEVENRTVIPLVRDTLLVYKNGYKASRIPALTGHNSIRLTPLAEPPTVLPKLVGNPLAKVFTREDEYGPYPRNIWDMKEHDGAIFLGCGNSSNDGPGNSRNAASWQLGGVLPIFSINTATGSVERYWEATDEQVDGFRVLPSGDLYTYSHDPSLAAGGAGNDNGHLYNVTKKEKIFVDNSGANHYWDVAVFRDMVYINKGSYAWCRPFPIEKNDEWKKMRANSAKGLKIMRFFLPFESVLLTTSMRYDPIGGTQKLPSGQELKYNFDYGPGFDIESRLLGDMPHESFVPADGSVNSSYSPGPTLRNITEYSADTVLYIAGHTHNDQQYLPVRLMMATTSREDAGDLTAREIHLPGITPASPVFTSAGSYTRPWDIVIKEWNGDRYVLIMVEEKTAPDDPNPTRMRMFCSKPNSIDEWDELFRFDMPTFARSFEYARGAFWFSLGSETESISSSINSGHFEKGIHPQTGELYKIEWPLFR